MGILALPSAFNWLAGKLVPGLDVVRETVAEQWFMAALFMGADPWPAVFCFSMAALAPLPAALSFARPRRPKALLLAASSLGTFWLATSLTDGLWAWWMYCLCRPLTLALGSGLPTAGLLDRFLVYGLAGAAHGLLWTVAVLAAMGLAGGRVRAYEAARKPPGSARQDKPRT